MDSDTSLNENSFIEYSFEAIDPNDYLVIESPTDSQPTGAEGGKKSRPKQKSYRKKVESVWSQESTIKLIAEVEERRSLWDAGCGEYKLPKDLLWQEVADAIGVSLNDCKGKWTNLRTTFNCNLEKYRKKKSGQGTADNFEIVWRYFKQMMFLETTKVRQSIQSISSMQLESTTTDDTIACDLGSAPCTSGQQRKRKIAPTTSSTPKTHLKEMAVEALQLWQRSDHGPKDPNIAYAEHLAAELNNLGPELAKIARSRLRRASNQILDDVALMANNVQE